MEDPRVTESNGPTKNNKRKDRPTEDDVENFESDAKRGQTTWEPEDGSSRANVISIPAQLLCNCAYSEFFSVLATSFSVMRRVNYASFFGGPGSKSGLAALFFSFCSDSDKNEFVFLDQAEAHYTQDWSYRDPASSWRFHNCSAERPGPDQIYSALAIQWLDMSNGNLPRMMIYDRRDVSFPTLIGSDAKNCGFNIKPPKGWCASEHVGLLVSRSMAKSMLHSRLHCGLESDAEWEMTTCAVLGEETWPPSSPPTMVLSRCFESRALGANVEFDSTLWEVFKRVGEIYSDCEVRCSWLDAQNVVPTGMTPNAMAYLERAHENQLSWEFEARKTVEEGDKFRCGFYSCSVQSLQHCRLCCHQSDDSRQSILSDRVVDIKRRDHHSSEIGFYVPSHAVIHVLDDLQRLPNVDLDGEVSKWCWHEVYKIEASKLFFGLQYDDLEEFYQNTDLPYIKQNWVGVRISCPTNNDDRSWLLECPSSIFNWSFCELPSCRRHLMPLDANGETPIEDFGFRTPKSVPRWIKMMAMVAQFHPFRFPSNK
jgi:hypothetical protein